ncbi:PQQ-dependent sugar dehydrogenase [Streptomyces sp. TRM 70361]|uniref:PQQ-dependent sugar dehydrogenase n=1 Tax=Streptomyces sp. TRM 70361 TaxID=3116553 RepID=UPI002E7B5899|nr:PQQ-dependent sugar dehydrogenase [Streptomyces sp. TRM 70361]MEE1938639.1 PQQ-dependent sugar dehydrogenase [Streptomyces sp. TRM 70361]
MVRSRSPFPRPLARRRPRAAAAGLAGLVLLAAGCTGGGGDSADRGNATDSATPGPSGEASRSPGASAAPAEGSVEVVETVATGLKSPWGLAPLPDGDLLVSSRDEGTVSRVDTETGETTELGSVPGVEPGGEGGLLGIALSPDFAEDRHVYAYFTSASDNRIVRMRYDADREPGEQLDAPSTVLRGIPKGVVHNGGRIAFGPDRMLYAGTGDSGDQSLSQDRESLGGKILRMTPDGEPPGRGNPEADSVVYSWGHRNVQGLAWDADKRLWASEFGQNTWDELNLIRPGGNYGWPEAEGRAGEDGFTDPVAQWKPAEASPSGIAVVNGSVWLAALRGERLWRVPLKGEETVADPQAFLESEYGRLRTVVPDGDGGLWLVTSETDSRGTPGEDDDRILRLEVS